MNAINARAKELHEFVLTVVGDSLSCSPTSVKLIEHLRPLFLACSLPVFGLELLHAPTRASMSFRVVSLRPNSDYDILKPEHRELLNDIHRALIAFPITRTESPKRSQPETLHSKLRSISSLVTSLRAAFRDNEESMERMSSLVKSQHTAIVQMTQGTG
jgi:hypothetical protein